MCEACSPTENEARPAKGRRMLWDFTDNAHCAVIGTCLKHEDLLDIARRLGLNVDRSARDYDVHGYFVKASTQDTREARAIHKILDTRFRGALRKFSRTDDEDAQIALWAEMRDGGQLAAAFYAIMTLRNIALAVRSQVFGEVHMISHLMGASWRDLSREVAALKDVLDEERTARKRIERSGREALAMRDRQIAALEEQVASVRATAPAAEEETRVQRRPADLSKVERALAATRERARLAERSCALLEAELAALRGRRQQRAAPPPPMANQPARDREQNLSGKRILYVGGKDSQVHWMRDYAEQVGAELVHHDGGLEQSVTRIEQVLPSVDCVLCPINCVSHDACLRAKAGCKKHGKPFMPLRSMGKKTFARALSQIATEIPA